MLDWVAESWATPSASDGTRGADLARRDNGQPNSNLPTQINQWMTPRSHEVGEYQYSRGDKTKPVPTLTGQAMALPAQTEHWPTPTALNRPREEATIEKSLAYRNAKAGQTTVPLYLEEVAVREACFRQGQTIPTSGAVPSKTGRSLNPLFVEWLMGWPPGWTLLAWTDFACSATELSLFKQRMRSALSQLASPAAAPPAQLALFA